MLRHELSELRKEFVEERGTAVSIWQDLETTAEKIIDIHNFTILKRADWELEVDDFLVNDSIFPWEGVAPS